MNPDKPHDKFFKETFSRTDITSDYLQVYLPESVRNRLDFQSLHRETDSYVDEQLSEHFTDLVFSARFDGQPIQVTLLLEHKSYTEKYPHFQLNRYMLNVWEQQIRQKAGLTPIIPALVYHGRSTWQKQSLTAYFAGLSPELKPFLPAFDYVLIDLTMVESKLPQLRSDYARLTGLLLQYSRRKRALVRMLDEHAELVRSLLASHSGQAFLETTFIYLNWASPLTNPEVIAIFHRISIEAGQLAMSAAQKLINEGVEQGMERGIRGMLRLNMDVSTIAAAFDVPREYVDQLIDKIRREPK